MDTTSAEEYTAPPALSKARGRTFLIRVRSRREDEVALWKDSTRVQSVRGPLPTETRLLVHNVVKSIILSL